MVVTFCNIWCNKWKTPHTCIKLSAAPHSGWSPDFTRVFWDLVGGKSSCGTSPSLVSTCDEDSKILKDYRPLAARKNAGDETHWHWDRIKVIYWYLASTYLRVMKCHEVASRCFFVEGKTSIPLCLKPGSCNAPGLSSFSQRGCLNAPHSIDYLIIIIIIPIKNNITGGPFSDTHTKWM